MDAKEKKQEEYFETIASANDEQSLFVEQYREEMGWSRKEHIEHASIEWQNSLTRSNLKKKFFQDNPTATEEDYKNYTDVLLENANIEYK